MIRVAAVGDVHVGVDSVGRLRPKLEHVRERADVFLIAGDLTKCGSPEEGAVLVDELQDIGVPVVAVLGNHDYHADQEPRLRRVLERGGVIVLEGEGTVVEVRGQRLGVAGVKGFGGGFAGACGSEFGEPEMKAFMRHTRELADRLAVVLADLDTDRKVALMHYAPVADTLAGERPEIYPFLGSYLLAEAVDRSGADLVVHGHAHGGTEKGVTAGGVHVRNVALPVLRQAYAVYCIGDETDVECATDMAPAYAAPG